MNPPTELELLERENARLQTEIDRLTAGVQELKESLVEIAKMLREPPAKRREAVQ